MCECGLPKSRRDLSMIREVWFVDTVHYSKGQPKPRSFFIMELRRPGIIQARGMLVHRSVIGAMAKMGLNDLGA
jgi:hypothetical protein